MSEQGIKLVNLPGWSHKGYSQAVLIPAGFEILEGAGTVDFDENEQVRNRPAGTKMGPDTLVAQFHGTLMNIVAIMLEAGFKPKDLVKVRISVRVGYAWIFNDETWSQRLGQVWIEIFGKHFPAAALFEVTRMKEDDVVVEIEWRAARAPLS